jgi:parvulin-like peptidyl-prolyl isomerase
MSEVNQPTDQSVQEEKAVVSSSKGNPKIFMALGLAVLILLGVVGTGVYRAYTKSASDKFTIKVAKILNLPAVKVGSDRISYISYIEDLKAIHIMRDFDKAQAEVAGQPGPGADLTEEQMSDQVLLRLVNNKVAENAAKKYDLTVSDDDVKVVKDKLLAQFKTEADLDAELMKRYGWNFASYESKVIRPFILQDKLAKKINEDTTMRDALRAQAEKALEEVKSGADFATLAKQHNPDSTAEAGGDLGWFGKGKMLPEFEKAAFSLKKGEVYPTLVETRFGYHIIKLDDRRVEKVKDSKGKMVSENQVQASHILFPFADLMSYLDKEMKANQPKLYLKVHNPFEIKSEMTTVQATK